MAEGDVEQLFTPYDRDVSVNVLRTLCRYCEIDLSEQAAAGIANHFESFICDSDKR